ncbi:WbqC family protein [Bosea sp. (in: a-proteobacteria)]|jgi:hypothetical protein|uniref:WbqC family protein n=1 Tax=Bosea sp. (in: a-proteobacteria) TaxID=1871050 RepID=UPI0035664FA1
MPDFAPTGKTISIMQPYFMPYAGYFRLLAGADLFVVYDCVQFPRRGWVHRNQLRLADGATDWLTLPLEKAPRDARIYDLAFRPDASASLEAQIRRFPALASPPPEARAMVGAMGDVRGTPVDYIVALLRLAATTMGLPWQVARSSELSLPPGLRAQDRILAIAKAHGATRYINPPGGRGLYDPAAFAAAGIELRFLTDHIGSYDSIAQRLASETVADIAREIRANTVWQA